MSHVAFASYRVEPTLWRVGQAAGTAVALAARSHTPLALHDVSVGEIQRFLYQQNVSYLYPVRPTCNSPTPPPPPPPKPACAAYVVVGAGDGDVNGMYKYNGTTADRAPVYVQSSTYMLYRYQGVWRLAHEGHTVFYTASGPPNLSEPPEHGWIVDIDKAPAPASVKCST